MYSSIVIPPLAPWSLIFTTLPQQDNQEIKYFLAQEYPDNQCSENEAITQVKQYDFVSKLPLYLKGKEGFTGISYDLKQAIGKQEILIVDYIPHRSFIAPVHCDSFLDWIEHYFRDILFLQAQVKRLAAQNSLLE